MVKTTMAVVDAQDLILDVQWEVGKDFAESGKSILSAPTGSSKTVIAYCAAMHDAAMYCHEHVIDDMSKCLVIFCADKAIAAQHVHILRGVCGVTEEDNLFTEARKMFGAKDLANDKPVILSQSHAQLSNLLKKRGEGKGCGAEHAGEDGTGYERLVARFERVLVVYDEVHDVLAQTKKTSLHGIVEMRDHIRELRRRRRRRDVGGDGDGGEGDVDDADDDDDDDQSMLRVMGLTATPGCFMKGGDEFFEKGTRGLASQARWMRCVLFGPGGGGVHARAGCVEETCPMDAARFMRMSTYALPFGYVDDIRRKLPHTICEEPMVQESGALPHMDKARLLLHWYLYMWLDPQVLPKWSSLSSLRNANGLAPALLLHGDVDGKYFKRRREEYTDLVNMVMIDTLYDQVAQIIDGAEKIRFVGASEEEENAEHAAATTPLLQPATFLLSAESVSATAYLAHRLRQSFAADGDTLVVSSERVGVAKGGGGGKTTTAMAALLHEVDVAIRGGHRVIAVVSDSFMQGYNGLNSRFSHLILMGERCEMKVEQARGRMERPVDLGATTKPSSTRMMVLTVGWLAPLHALSHSIGRTRGGLSRTTRANAKAKISVEERARDAMVAQMRDAAKHGPAAAEVLEFVGKTTPRLWLMLLNADPSSVDALAAREKGLLADEAVQVMLRFAGCPAAEAAASEKAEEADAEEEEDMVRVNLANSLDMSLHASRSDGEAEDDHFGASSSLPSKRGRDDDDDDDARSKTLAARKRRAPEFKGRAVCEKRARAVVV